VIPSPPPEVRNLIVQRSGGQLTLIWDRAVADPAVTEYRVYRSSSRDFSGAVRAGTTSGTSFTEPLTSSPSPAYFKVSAVNTIGEGPR
jgi:hypothetical protein